MVVALDFNQQGFKKIMELALIAAVASNGVIGVDGKMPWHIPEDLKRFKELTTGHVVIMGRKTFDSIGKPLPNRMNIVISRSDICQKGFNIARSPLEALKFCIEAKYRKLFVIGGEAIFKAFMPLANKMHITHVHKLVRGDTFFPMCLGEWKVENQSDQLKHNGLSYRFTDYARK